MQIQSLKLWLGQDFLKKSSVEIYLRVSFQLIDIKRESSFQTLLTKKEALSSAVKGMSLLRFTSLLSRYQSLSDCENNWNLRQTAR